MTASIVKSGTNRLELTAETYTQVVGGGTFWVFANQRRLTNVSTPCAKVYVAGDPVNNATIYLGGETHGCHLPLGPTTPPVMVPIDDASKLYVRAGVPPGAGWVHWLALG